MVEGWDEDAFTRWLWCFKGTEYIQGISGRTTAILPLFEIRDTPGSWRGPACIDLYPAITVIDRARS